ncbi:MAG TPA: hypothetical protein PLX58_00160 [Smithellaceae bacterium]|jgi:hypothetical protein|nr:hypothetical protein [Smithellaceae bacterium]HQG80985.1 hypothetical protein [Smithellaceae bacterium]
MVAIRHNDPIIFFEMLLLELFHAVFHNDSARRCFGFSQISQVITQDGLPAWYLWFSDKCGAFLLTVTEGHNLYQETVCSAHEDSGTLRARLLIRYFPDVDDSLFNTLSTFEQILRKSSFFDSTGTPSFEEGIVIPEGFFVAGCIDVIAYSTKTDVDFYCSAPDRWRDYRLNSLNLTDNNGESCQKVSPGCLDRDFPGWDISFFLFDKLISSFCFLSNQAPCCAGAASRPFVHYEIDSKHSLKAVHDPDITKYNFGVSFNNCTKPYFLKKRHYSFVEALESLDHIVIGIWENPDSIPMHFRRPQWWTIGTTHFHSECNNLCSCYDDH